MNVRLAAGFIIRKSIDEKKTSDKVNVISTLEQKKNIFR